jgi:PAS domain-containing protein
LGKDKASLKSPDVLLSNVQGAIGLLLPALFESPVMGVALLDSQFRFRAINGALAAMNGLPVSSHMGRSFGMPWVVLHLRSKSSATRS